MSVRIMQFATNLFYEDDKIDKLKPCPFCGKDDKILISSAQTFQKLYCEYGSATIHLDCTRCGLSLYEHSYHGSHYAVKAKRLIKKWNNRKEVSDEYKKG